MNEGFAYYRGSLDNAIDMCERHLMCGRWPSAVHPLCERYSAAAMEFHRVLSELCVRIDQARAQQTRDGGDA